MTNVDRVRDSYVAFGRGDLEAALEHFDDDVVWEQAQGLPHAGTYHGLNEVRRNVFEPLDREWWSSFTADPAEFLEAGGNIVVLGRYRGVAQGTGKTLDVPFVHIWTFAGERAVRFRQFLDTAGWNDALAHA
jgi:ketosteroid isomerase-like protein